MTGFRDGDTPVDAVRLLADWQQAMHDRRCRGTCPGPDCCPAAAAAALTAGYLTAGLRGQVLAAPGVRAARGIAAAGLHKARCRGGQGCQDADHERHVRSDALDLVAAIRQQVTT